MVLFVFDIYVYSSIGVMTILSLYGMICHSLPIPQKMFSQFFLYKNYLLFCSSSAFWWVTIVTLLLNPVFLCNFLTEIYQNKILVQFIIFLLVVVKWYSFSSKVKPYPNICKCEKNSKWEKQYISELKFYFWPPQR